MKVLVISGDQWHPSEIVKKGLEGITEYQFDFVENAKDILIPSMLKEYKVILLSKTDNLNSGNSVPWFEKNVTEVGPDEFYQYVADGGGMLAVHSGMCFGYNLSHMTGMVKLIGSRFLSHPPRCTVNVKIFAEHPITKGISDFEVRDEHYQIVDVVPDATQILQTVSETGGVQVGGYVRNIGKGRLCAFTPGHILSVWQHPNYRQLIKNALEWCMGNI